MINKTIVCEHCGYQAEVGAVEGHEPYHCPACGRVSYAHLGSRDEGENLRIMPQRGAKYEVQTCPNCGVSIPADAVLCTECGYNLEQKAVVRNRRMPDQRVLIAGAVSAVVVLLVGGIFFFMFHSLDRVSTTDEPEPQVETAGIEEENNTPSPEKLPDPQPVVPSDYSESNYLAAVEARVDTWRNEFEVELDARFPQQVPGQQVVLRRSTGLIHRGILKKAGPVFLELEQDGVVMQIPVEELDRSTRLKCDPLYRKRYVEYRTAKKREELEALPKDQLMQSVPDL